MPDIIEGCLAGDRKAQKMLYEMFSGKMYAVCLRYADDEEEASDMLQDGFIRVFENLSSFRHRGSFEGWVRRIMINTALEKFRRKKNFYSLNDEEEGKVEPSEENTLDDLFAKELIGMIQELTPQYRMVFNLYALEGYSHKEIAGMMGISEGTSKSNLARARTILQEKLKKLRREKR